MRTEDELNQSQWELLSFTARDTTKKTYWQIRRYQVGKSVYSLSTRLSLSCRGIALIALAIVVITARAILRVRV